jgi:hypothetical protein
MALPLAARPRRGSRSGGFLLALLLICGYYVIFTVGAGLARDGLLPVWLGVWAANIAAATVGLLMLPGVNRMPEGGIVDRALTWILVRRSSNELRCANRETRNPAERSNPASPLVDFLN